MQIIRNLIIFYAFFVLFFVVHKVNHEEKNLNSTWGDDIFFKVLWKFDFSFTRLSVRRKLFHLLKCLSASSNSIKLWNFSDFSTQNEKSGHKLIANKFFLSLSLFVGIRQGLCGRNWIILKKNFPCHL